MRRWFSNISLRWKLVSVTVLTTVVALVLAGVIMASYDARTYESQKAGAITSEAKILAASVAAALVFDDSQAATEYLKALDANPEIVAAAAYGANGKLVTSYSRPENQQSVPDAAGKHGYYFEGGNLEVFVPVSDGTATIGSVFLRASVEPVAVRLSRYTLILLLIGAGSLAITLPISFWLHRLISNPLEELAAKNAIIKATLDSVDHGVVVVDGDMDIAFLNDRVSALFGAFMPKMAGSMNFEAIMQEGQGNLGLPEHRRERDLQRLRSPEHSRDHYTLPDGRTIEYRQAPLPYGGFVRTYTDVSEEKLLQDQLQRAKAKAEEADSAKSHFLAAMSHEIRTPMNGVIGIIELLRATPLNDEQKQMVEIVRQSGISLLDVINDILDYSKIEAGRMTVETTEVALTDVIETTAEVMGGHTKSKFLNIICSVDPRIDEVVLGDPVRIRQVILNLMGNALKFTESGMVGIQATAEAIDDDQITVVFEVTDTGLGIEADKQKQLFEAFTQADYSTTRRFGGTGLGLSISKNLVELMGGTIGVRSSLGRGSTFWFRVPFGRLPPEKRANSFEKYTGILSGLRVLVYDAIASRPPAAIYLRAAGVEVLEAAEVADSIGLLFREAAAGRTVDMVIASVRVGDDSAAQLVKMMQQYQQLKSVKVVLVVPHLSTGAAQLVSQLPIALSVPAPVQRVKFYDAIAYAAGRVARSTSETSTATHYDAVAPTVEEALAHGCLILVAEDNQTNQFVIKSQMRRLGYAAEFVSDGRAAWEVLSRDENRYGLVITDCHMPFVDGYQLTGLIREREQTTGRRLPVVALTANALQGASEICTAAGMDGYMFKPTNLPTLDAMIQKWLPQAAALRQVPGRAKAPDQLATVSVAEANAKNLGSAEPPIDMTVMARLLGNDDPAALQEMIELYWTSEADTPGKLRELVDARDGANLALAAHAAKGAASSAGAVIVAALCKDLENCAAHQDWSAADGLAVKIDHAFGDVRAFIDGSQKKKMAS